MNDPVEFLEHHGIKGQKWGRRKARTPRITSQEHKVASDLRKKHVSTLTNEELKTLNARSNLEQQHRRLNPNTAAKGRKYVKAAMGTAVGAATLYGLATGPAGKALTGAVKKTASK
jgi:hypothetical protein